MSSPSVRLSWLLRHGARESGLPMDPAGWADVADVLRVLRIPREVLDRAVAENTKSRLELRGARIRASQGHSPGGTPVTLEALEASWAVHPGEGTIWHGTHAEAIAGIARAGVIHAGERTHVHLADALGSRVGKRAHVDYMLGASPARLRAAGLVVYRSPNGVLLVRQVPRECLLALVPMTPGADARAAELRALLGLPAPA
jgi:putative RNA 2'-phosphotransferase